jgi:UDP-glucose 4-epimerase
VRILVTGGAGFIGAHLVAQLTAGNTHEVLVLDNLHRGYSRACLPSTVHLSQGDIRDKSTVDHAVRGCEVVFHLAAQSNVLGAVADADYAFSSNVIGTYNVLESSRAAGVKRLVFTSSREVYGDPKQIPVPETASLHPKNAYGASKAAGEIYCKLAATQGLETVVLRLANVYGPGDRDRVIPLFLAAALENKPMTVFGSRKTLDFVWIDTVVDILMKAAQLRAVVYKDVYQDVNQDQLANQHHSPRSLKTGSVNVGSGTGTSVADLARRIVQLTNSASSIQTVEERGQEVGQFVADIARARQIFDLAVPIDPLWALPEMINVRVQSTNAVPSGH